MVALAVVFLFCIFILKTKTGGFKNPNLQQKSALVYDNTTVLDLINKSTNGSGIPDWEYSLLGGNINKNSATSASASALGGANTSDQTLNQTDQLGREIFSTMAALNQAGQVDQDTINKISDSLATQIQNPVVRKVYLISDLTTSQDNSAGAVQKYKNTLIAIYAKYPSPGNVLDVLKEFIGNGTNVDDSALVKLTPIEKQTQEIINARIKMTVPSDLAQMHLDVINALERLMENLQDIQLYDSDPVVTLGAMSKYNDNITALGTAYDALSNAINQKLNN